MPIKTTLEDGQVIDTYTPEELEAEKAKALEAFKATNPDKSAEMDALQGELKKVNEELGKFKDKDLNFSNLREQKDKAEQKAKDLAAEIDGKISNAKKEILEGVLQDHFQDTLKALAPDEEVRKKVEYHYKRLADPAANKQEITKKLTDAYLLATGTPNPGVLNSAAISSGNAAPINNRSTQPFSAEEKEMANKMAQAGGLGPLKDEDFK